MLKRKILFPIILSVLLCSCSNSELSSDESKVTSDTINAPFTTSDINSTVIDDEEIIEREETPMSSFDFLGIVDASFTYDGEDVKFQMGIGTGLYDCSYAIGLFCDGKLVPFSIDGNEYALTQNIDNLADTASNFIISFKPYGKAGETLTVQPLIVVNTKAKPLNDYNVQSPLCGYVPAILPTGYVTLNVDGIDSEENSTSAEISEVMQEIVDFYTKYDEENASLSEDGVLTKTLETNNIIEILDPDNNPENYQSWAYDSYMISDGQLEFDALFYGQPNKVSICCWSDKGFLPVFDGKYTAEVELEEFYQQAKIHCKLEDESFGKIERIEMIAFDEDRYVYLSGATGVITSQTYEDFLKWCETLE